MHTEVSLTDADARKMRDAQRGGFFIGYNVQLAVDAKHMTSSPRQKWCSQPVIATT